MLAWLLNPAIIGLAALFLAILWMLRDETDRTRPWLVIALVVNLAYGWLLSYVMGRENGLVPWKYDYVLLHLDGALGLRAASIAAELHRALVPLFVAYQLMVPMMIAWFLVARSAGQAGAIIVAYIVEMIVGPALYALVPACGPIYAFQRQWLNPPPVNSIAIRMSGMPNAFPSLHLATALIFVLFAPRTWARAIAVAFLAATALATIATGEHYVIDLVAGAAFGCMASAIARRRVAASLLFACMAFGWSLVVRLDSAFLLGHAAVLQVMAGVTVLAACAYTAAEWRGLAEKAPVQTAQAA